MIYELDIEDENKPLHNTCWYRLGHLFLRTFTVKERQDNLLGRVPTVRKHWVSNLEQKHGSKK